MEIKGKFEKELEEYSNRITESKEIINDLSNYELNRGVRAFKLFIKEIENVKINSSTLKEFEELKKVIEEVIEKEKRD